MAITFLYSLRIKKQATIAADRYYNILQTGRKMKKKKKKVGSLET